MSKRCYYETLSVSRTATDSEIKTSYRKLAMQWHPDRNKGDASSEAKFKEITEAYDILKDGDRRAAYDRFGHAAFEQGNGASAHGFGNDFGSAFSDIFEGIFGMAGRAQPLVGRPRARRRSPLQHGDHAGGRLLRQDRRDPHPDIRHLRNLFGLGAKAGTRPTTCGTCGGAGRVRQAQGFFTLERTCPSCQGRGQVIEDPLPIMRRLRPRDARTHAVGQYSAGCGRRHPHPARR